MFIIYKQNMLLPLEANIYIYIYLQHLIRLFSLLIHKELSLAPRRLISLHYVKNRAGAILPHFAQFMMFWPCFIAMILHVFQQIRTWWWSYLSNIIAPYHSSCIDLPMVGYVVLEIKMNWKRLSHIQRIFNESGSHAQVRLEIATAGLVMGPSPRLWWHLAK